MDKTYIGIDPGAKGFVAAMYGDGRREYCSIADGDYYELAKFLEKVKDGAAEGCVCCMESIHAIFGSSAKATFSFGEVYGVLQGLLVALRIPYHLVPPKTWQKEIWINEDKVWKNSGGEKTVDNKATSINAAKRLFPEEDFRRSVRCRNVDDNKCDATLIAEYGRRKCL